MKNLFEAIEARALSKIQQILETDSEAVSHEDSQGRTPLHWAAEAGLAEIVSMLLSHHADINAEIDYPYYYHDSENKEQAKSPLHKHMQIQLCLSAISQVKKELEAAKAELKAAYSLTYAQRAPVVGYQYQQEPASSCVVSLSCEETYLPRCIFDD